MRGVIRGGTCSTVMPPVHTYYININHNVLRACLKGVFTREKLVYLFTLWLTVIPTQAFSYENKFTQDPPNRFTGHADKLIISGWVTDYKWETTTLQAE